MFKRLRARELGASPRGVERRVVQQHLLSLELSPHKDALLPVAAAVTSLEVCLWSSIPPYPLMSETVYRCMSTEEKKKPSKADYRRKKKKLKVFDHQIHQKLATDVIGVSFDAQ